MSNIQASFLKDKNNTILELVDQTARNQNAETSSQINDMLSVEQKPSKNLNLSPYSERTQNGITLTADEDNVVYINGTATGYAYTFNANAPGRFKLNPGVYTLSIDAPSGVHAYLLAYPSEVSTEAIMESTKVSYNSSTYTTFKLESACYCIVQIRVDGGTVAENAAVKVQLEAGEVATEFASPFAAGNGVISKRIADIELEADTTQRLINIQPGTSRNLITKKFLNKTDRGVTFTANDDNTVALSGTATGYAHNYNSLEALDMRFELLPGTYTLSIVTPMNGFYAYILGFETETGTEAILSPRAVGYNEPERTFEVTTACYAQAQIQVAEGTVTDGVVLKIQLERGTEATEYISPWGNEENKRSKRLDDIEAMIETLDDNVNPFRVPSYYFVENYIQNRIAAVKSKMIECMGHGDAFIFITDEHWSLNAQNSPKLINYISKNLNINKLFSGGDRGDNETYIDCAESLKKCFPGRVYYTNGNHDYFLPNTGSKLAYYLDMYNDDIRTDNAERNYGYIDNHRARVRYVILSAYSPATESLAANPGYEEAQINWLTSTALDVPDGWAVVVITHCVFVIGESTEVVSNISEAADLVTALDNYNANEASKGVVACVIQGHTHKDRVSATPGGIPIVSTACDKCDPWIDGAGVNREPWLADRVRGTITEQAFDIVVLDKDERKLFFYRIGAQAMDGVGDEFGEAVDVREVSY